jgi:uncharacterized DUF497 family protein
MRFTWDGAKRQSNLRNHGYDFADAYRVFQGPIVLAEDCRDDYGDQRMIAHGLLDAVVVVVIHIESDQTIRIISMRKGDKHETNRYYEEIGAG